eukprot:7889672-Alexandrium_andersonii.AAC.1
MPGPLVGASSASTGPPGISTGACAPIGAALPSGRRAGVGGGARAPFVAEGDAALPGGPRAAYRLGRAPGRAGLPRIAS